jgi:hypothetical protein
MWSGHGGQAGAKADHPAPRTPHQNDLRPIPIGGQPSGQGAVNPVVKARSQWGSGLVKAVSPLSQPLRTRERRGRDSGCALTTVTTVTEEAHRDREAPRPRVHPQRQDRAVTRVSSVAARRGCALLADRGAAHTGAALRRGAPRPGGRSLDLEPCAGDREEQPLRGWTTRGGHHERANISTAALGQAGLARGARAVVTGFFFGGWCNPRLRLQEQNPPLNWRIS